MKQVDVKLWLKAKALADKMHLIMDSGEYRRVFMMAVAHGTPYRGETWETELKALEECLAERNDRA